MTATSQSSEPNGLAEDAPAVSNRLTSASDRWSSRTDAALLASALFVQRFTLPFPGGKSVSLTILPVMLIFGYQFAANRLLLHYDRLPWFVLLVLFATTSLLLNFNNSTLTSYSLFLMGYFLFTLSRPSPQYQYKRTLHSFQYFVFIISCLAIVQFPAQLMVDPQKLIMFFGIFPDALLPYHAKANTLGIISATGQFTKSNGIFLAESSSLSQIAAVAILIELIEFQRPLYLIVLSIGFLLAYSGTGVSILLISFPVAFLVTRRAQLAILLVCLFAAGLFAMGIIHLSVFTGRLGEFQDTSSSGFTRFVSPFWMAAEYFNTASLLGLLFGNGLGHGFVPRGFYSASGDTWFNVVYEYGLIGAFAFACFLHSSFRRSWCPAPVIVGIVYNYLFTGNNLFDPAGLTIMVVLCTFRPRPIFQASPLRKPQRQSVMERASQDSVALDPPSLT
jgi:hypothetical protein